MAGVSTWALAGEPPAAGPVRLVVGLKSDAPASATAAGAVASMGVRSMDAAGPAQKSMSELRAHTMEVPASRQASIMATLMTDPNVAYVEVDHVRKTSDVTPNDPMYTEGRQPEVDQVKLPASWEHSTGSAVKVAVLDTGVTAVGDLAGAVLPGYNYVSNTTNTTDDYGHGTMVSSLIAARGNNDVGIAGACWTCVILPVKVLNSAGSGYDSDVAKGIVWATNNGAKIINMSLGGAETSQVLSDAVAYANMKGVLVVAAAGNENSAAKHYPAALTDVVAVGATERGSETRAPYSNYGSTWVDMVAPGNVTVMDRFGNYHSGLQGTSFAAPMVAGAAALVKTEHPDFSGWSLGHAVTVGARPISGGSWAHYGMLDADKSLTIGTDSIAPTITGVSNPGSGWRVHGIVNVTPTGVADTSGSGVRTVVLYADDVYVTQDGTAPYSLPYNTIGRNGPVKLQVRVYDKAGNRADFDRTFIADNTGPTVKITSAPKDGAKVSGTVKIAVTATDTYGMRRVELLINGKVIQTDTTSPYNFSFNAASQATKMKVQIRAIDIANNTKYEATRNYTR
ncbi:S8 family serine peptidase [Actinoplanes sp. NPDC026623]|uniref:S8 family serine peptidase n=1 Tax=Actinoplanes sp. NPDC026623 TaxID=3155610 RepID=UPI00340E5194